MADITRREGGSGRDIGRSFGGGGRIWDPFRMLQGLLPLGGSSELERMVGRPSESVFVPDFDVLEMGDQYIFKADLPGVKAEDLEVTVAGNQITISGKREEEELMSERARYYVSERPVGSFSRSFILPEGCDAEHVEAHVDRGVLTLKVPKRPEVKARKVQISGAQAGETGASTSQKVQS